jgi:hypothetical protein
MSQLDWAQREKIVIGFYKKGVSPKEIAHQLEMSLRDLFKVVNKTFGTKEKEITTEHQAIILSKKGKRPTDVAIKLRISLDKACRYYGKCKESFYLGKFGQDHNYIQGYMPQLLEICEVMKNAGLNMKEVLDESKAYMSMTRDLGELEHSQLYLKGVEELKQEKAKLIQEKAAKTE